MARLELWNAETSLNVGSIPGLGRCHSDVIMLTRFLTPTHVMYM